MGGYALLIMPIMCCQLVNAQKFAIEGTVADKVTNAPPDWSCFYRLLEKNYNLQYA